MASEAFDQWWADYQETGDTGIVRLNATRDDVRSWFGEPDDLEATNSRGRGIPSIWKYGLVEFHFHGDLLWLVFTDEHCYTEDTDEDCKAITILLRK